MPQAPTGLFPPDPVLTAHCDGGARGNPGPSGYGAVIADPTGKILAQLSEYLGHRTNNFAEYSGLLGVLQWALDNHQPNLHVISDSELMVKQIQGKYKVKSPDLLPLWQEARRRISQLHTFEITHALRHKNKDADRLANEAMDRGTNKPKAVPAPTIDRPASTASSTSPAAPQASTKSLRGFTRNGVIHLLDDATLPDGIFVKITRD